DKNEHAHELLWLEWRRRLMIDRGCRRVGDLLLQTEETGVESLSQRLARAPFAFCVRIALIRPAESKFCRCLKSQRLIQGGCKIVESLLEAGERSFDKNGFRRG